MPAVEKAEEETGLLSIIPYLKGVKEGDPHLAGNKCKACGAVFLDERTVCAACSARDQIEPVRLSDKGTLHVYSIVHRSFPGIKTPFISAVVDLEGGGAVKGNLINVDPEPDKIEMGMPVEVVYEVAPVKDRDGNEYMTYYFQPAS